MNNQTNVAATPLQPIVIRPSYSVIVVDPPWAQASDILAEWLRNPPPSQDRKQA